MEDIILTNEIISKIKIDVFDLTRKLMGGDLKAVIWSVSHRVNF